MVWGCCHSFAFAGRMVIPKITSENIMIEQSHPSHVLKELWNRLGSHSMDIQLDLQEIYYYVNDGALMRNDDVVKESTAVNVRDSGNTELADLLTTGDGPLASGAQPAMLASSEAGRKALAESLHTDGKAEVKKTPKRKGEEKAEKVEPKTLQEWDPQQFFQLFENSDFNIKEICV